MEAIRRVLHGQSTLLLLGTGAGNLETTRISALRTDRWRLPLLRSTLTVGAGKSLCFQLPALVLSETYKALTIVVTPLVALMEDHMRRLPLGLRGAALHGNLPVRREPWPRSACAVCTH